MTKCEVHNTTLAFQANNLNYNIDIPVSIDLNTNHSFDNISQIVTITNPSQYLVTVKWMPPYGSPIGKKFKV